MTSVLDSPALWLALTIVSYHVGVSVQRRYPHPLLHPVLIAIALLSTLLLVARIDYGTYFRGAAIIHFLLGPATVALAIPLYRNIEAIKRSLVAIVSAVLVGATTAVVSAIGLAALFGADDLVVRSLAPKSVTTPIAVAVTEKVGGLPSLTAVVVIMTGITGAALGSWVLDRARVRDPQARGLAFGVASHGIGTARALQESVTTGAFAGLAMGLNGLATAIFLPLSTGWGA